MEEEETAAAVIEAVEPIAAGWWRRRRNPVDNSFSTGSLARQRARFLAVALRYVTQLHVATALLWFGLTSLSPIPGRKSKGACYEPNASDDGNRVAGRGYLRNRGCTGHAVHSDPAAVMPRSVRGYRLIPLPSQKRERVGVRPREGRTKAQWRLIRDSSALPNR